MPRKKNIEWREQVYDIGDGATVTVRFDASRRPKMKHDDRVAIIGDHTCAAQHAEAPIDYELPRYPREVPAESVRRSNIWDADSPEFKAAKARLEAAQPAEPAPSAGLSTQDVFAAAGLSAKAAESLIAAAASGVLDA